MGLISDGILNFVRGKRVVPPIPPGRAVTIGEFDEHPTPARRDHISSLALFIAYVDAKGDASERRVVCRSYDRSADIINAWCFERSAVRAFRCDRITSAACTETGELFDLPELVTILRARGLPVRDAGLNAALKILTFLMRCDGIHAREKIVLEDAITSYAMRFDGDDAMVELAMKQARTMAPDERDFLKALRFVTLRSDGPALARFIRTQARLMIDADGQHSPQETRFAIELDAALAKAAEKA